MTKWYINLETEALIRASLEQALRAEYIKCRIDNPSEGDTCRICRQNGETMAFYQSIYVTIYVTIWQGLTIGNNHKLEGVTENDNTNILQYLFNTII